VPRICAFRSSETVDRYDQRSGHTEYRNSHAGGRKADHLTAALMWVKRSIEHIGKLAVPQESVNRESGAQEREANPENDVQVPRCRAVPGLVCLSGQIDQFRASAALAADRLYWVSAVHRQPRPGSLDVIVGRWR